MYLVITIRFLGDRYHGRLRNAPEPEWPPSPLRLYQAMLAGAAARWHDASIRNPEEAAFKWFESLDAPGIVTPGAQAGRPHLKYVPENLEEADPEKRKRDAKVSCPILFSGEPKLTYYWPIHSKDEQVARLIAHCAGHCRALGWGIDMAIGNGTVVEKEPELVAGDKWLPTANVDEGVQLRVPRQQTSLGQSGTLEQLKDRFAASLNRIAQDGRNPVPPLSAFRVVGYRRATDPPAFPFAAFKLLKPDASGYRPFDPTRQATIVAGMVRHALDKVARLQRPFGWDDAQIARVVVGHEANGKAVRFDPCEPRFAYLPLPTIEHRGQSNGAYHVGSIRRVVVVGMPGMEQEIQWVRRALSGAELIREEDKTLMAIVSLIPSNDWVVQQYCQKSSAWVTVTPVIIPGYDDRRPVKTGRLLRKALRQAGFSNELVDHAALDWRNVGYLPGVDLAARYRRPRNINEAPVCHVRIQWRDGQDAPLQLAGPLAVGSGRFRGLGLFASFGE